MELAVKRFNPFSGRRVAFFLEKKPLEDGTEQAVDLLASTASGVSLGR